MAKLSKAKRLAKDFSDELLGLTTVAAIGGGLNPAVHARLLESVFVKAFTEFEWFLEELFFAILTGTTRVDGARPRIRVRDTDLARVVAGAGSGRYLTWLPLDETTARAERLLVGGQPFVRLSTRAPVRNDLRRAQFVRNATAHKSAEAQKKFQTATSHSFATAGDFLASSSGGQTACQSILNNLNRYGAALVGSTAEADQLLGPSDPIRSGAKPGAGSYDCQSCGRTYQVGIDDPLRCAVCDPPCATCGRRSASATFQEQTN